MMRRRVASSTVILLLFYLILVNNAFATNGGALLKTEFDRKHQDSVALGCGHTLAIQPTGTVEAWGNNSYGQLGDGSTTHRSKAVTVIADTGLPLTNIIGVAAGCEFSLALRADGTVWSWGRNDQKQLGNNSAGSQSSVAIQVKTGASTFLTGAIGVAAGYHWGLAIMSDDGKVFGWGNSSSKQLGRNATGTQTYATAFRSSSSADFDRVVSVAAGPKNAGWQTLLLRADGQLWAVGQDVSNYPITITDGGTSSTNSQVKAVVAGGINGGTWFQYILRGNGELWSRGNSHARNSWGTTGSGGNGFLRVVRSAFPVSTPLESVVSVSAGSDHVVALDAYGTVWSVGGNAHGQAGTGFTSSYMRPVDDNTNYVAAFAGGETSMALLANGTLRGWGRNTWGQVGDETTNNRSYSVPVSGYSPDKSFISVSAYDKNIQLLRSDGTVWVSGDDSVGGIGDGSSTSYPNRFRKALMPAPTKMIASSAGVGAVLGAVTDAGKPYAWGANAWGAVGDNTYGNNRTAPTAQQHEDSTLPPAQQMSMGVNNSAILRGDGDVDSTGHDQCRGEGGYLTKLYRQRYWGGVWDRRLITSVALGSFHKVARTGDGNILGCGINTYGEAGVLRDESNGGFRNSQGLGPWKGKINWEHPWEWFTIFCDESLCGSWSGVVFMTRVAGGARNSFYQNGHNLVSFSGKNEFGEAGDGSTTNRWGAMRTRFSVASGDSIRVRAIASGNSNTALAIDSDGKLIAIGKNSSGQYCNNTVTSNNWAKSVNVGNLFEVSAGGSFIAGLRANGSPFYCGDNPNKINGTCDAVAGNTRVPVTLGCRPSNPASLAQKSSGGATIANNGWTKDGIDTAIDLSFTTTDSDLDEWLTPWVELKPVGTNFNATCGEYESGVYRGAQVNPASVGATTTLTVPVTGLNENVQYRWRACVTDTFGNATAWTNFTASGSNFRIDVTPPIPNPLNGSAAPQQTSILWTITSNASDSMSGLHSQAYSFDNGATWSSSKTYNQTGLTPDTAYSVHIMARDAAGNVTTSKQISSRTSVGIPTSVTITGSWSAANNYFYQLTWVAPPGGAKSYVIRRDADGSVAATTTSLSVNVTNQNPNTTNKYRVCAVNNDDEESSVCAVSGNATTPPAAPGNVQLNDVTSTSMKATWNTSTGATSYRLVLYQGTACSGSGTTHNPASSGLILSGLALDVPYRAQIQAYSNASGNWGALSTCTTPTGNGRTALVVSLGVGEGLVDLGDMIPGAQADFESNLSVTMNASSGYSVTARAQSNLKAGSKTIPMNNSGTVGTPPGSSAGTWTGDGWGLTVASAPALEAGWANGTKWARVETGSAPIIHTSNGIGNGSQQTTVVKVKNRVKIPLTQDPGVYSATLVYTVIPLG